MLTKVKIMMGEEKKITQQGTTHVLYHFQLGVLVLKLFLQKHDPEVTQTLSVSL